MMELLFRSWVDNHYEHNVPVNKNGKYSHCVSTGFARQYDPSYKEYDVEQFTGLVDKNGERIFEGDIISTDLARDFLVVEFKGGAFVFNCNDGEDDYYDHINASHELDNEYKYGQIIGNIHDNPELVEA